MPYIIKTGKRFDDTDSGVGGVIIDQSSVLAVATHFDAREEAAYRVELITGGDPDYEQFYINAQCCSEKGESFGPLSDGTVVVVERISWPNVAKEVDQPWPQADRPAVFGRLIDAWNAKDQ